MTTEEKKNQQLYSINTTNDISFLSPIFVPSPRLSVAVDLDREIVRSVSIFGEAESIKDLAKRLPALNILIRKEGVRPEIDVDFY